MFDTNAVEQGLQPDSNDVTAARARAWLAHLERHKVDYERLSEVYDEAVDQRVMRRLAGQYVGPFGIEDFIAAWLEVRRRPRPGVAETDASRLLAPAASIHCIKCLGTNRERLFDERGSYTGDGEPGGCDHRAVPDGMMGRYLNDPKALDYYREYYDRLPISFETFRREAAEEAASG
jgi:hypothetical protein